MRSVGSLESGHQRQLHPFRFPTTFLKQHDDGDDDDGDDCNDQARKNITLIMMRMTTEVLIVIILMCWHLGSSNHLLGICTIVCRCAS